MQSSRLYSTVCRALAANMSKSSSTNTAILWPLAHISRLDHAAQPGVWASQAALPHRDRNNTQAAGAPACSEENDDVVDASNSQLADGQRRLMRALP